MALIDDLQNDLDNVFFNSDDFSREITYVSSETQDQFVIQAIVDFFNEPGFSGMNKSKQGQIIIKESDIAEPKNQDEVWINTVKYRVDTLLSTHDGHHIIQIRRLESMKAK